MMRATLGVILLGTLAAQPAPTPSTPDVSGTWLLDKDVSADLTKLSFIPQAPASGNRNQGNQGRTRRGGFGGARSNTLTKEEQSRAKSLAEDVKTGWAKLVISQHDGTLAINDEKDRTYFLKTDGTAVDNHVGALTLSSATHVDGDHLVTEWPAGSHLTLVYSFTPVSGGRQLVVRVTHKNGSDARDSLPFEPSAYFLYKKSTL